MAEKKPKPELPLSLRAGNIQPMEGMAAPKPAEYYVSDCAYIGYPLIRGQRIFVVADGGEVRYQDDTAVIPAPDAKIDEVFVKLYGEVGSFVLEGVVVYPDAHSKGHRSDGKGLKGNEENVDPDSAGRAEIHIYRTLYLKDDLRSLTEDYRNMIACTLTKLTDNPAAKIVKANKGENDKAKLLHKPAIWFLKAASYRPGLDQKRQPMVNQLSF